MSCIPMTLSVSVCMPCFAKITNPVVLAAQSSGLAFASRFYRK